MKAILKTALLMATLVDRAAIAYSLPPDPNFEVIIYAVEPCFGPCPVYTLTVSSDGTAHFEGKEFTAAKDVYFKVTPTQLAEFRRRLTAIVPDGERILAGQTCDGPMYPHWETIDITWLRGVPGAHLPGDTRTPRSHLRANLGCNRKSHQELYELMTTAIDALPVQHLIGAP